MTDRVGHLLSFIANTLTGVVPPWTDKVPYNTEPEGWLVGPVVKATRTSTQPIDQHPANRAGYLMPGFGTDFYNRILVEPGVLNIGNLVSDQFRVIRVFNGYFVSKTLEALQVQDGEGIAVQGDTPPTIFGPLKTKTYGVTVSTNGPPTIDALLRFNFEGSTDDINVPIQGARITSLPYQAEAPYKETLEWKTQIIIPNDGAIEQRIRLRKHPRQSFAGTYPIPASEMQRAQNIVYGWLTRNWAIPVWSEARRLGAVPPGTTDLLCDPTTGDFRVGGLAQIWDTSRSNEVVEIDAVLSDRLVLRRATAGSYNAPVLLPVRSGRCNGNATRRTSGYDGALDMTFQVSDNLDLSALAPIPSQFLGEDIYYDEAILPDDDLEDTISGRVDMTDYDTGPWDAFAPWKYNQISRPYSRVLRNARELWDFRLWVHRRAGRLKPFWMPSFESDLRLDMTGIVSSSIIVLADDYRNLGDAHKHVAIQLRDGTWYPRTVTGTAIVDENHLNLALDAPLNVDASLLTRISYLGLKRLDSDQVVINHRGGGVAVSTIKILEIQP